ncbi:type 1 glutamine amidotransferase domain-containing protein [Prauserella rugosa]|uniref:type 1 glutamine amidotransferase domain-containing protein n=1 Tax=Prauserella rugosa TaxID=43354 RepID=UPI0004C2FF33|nr:type 1 glutamine amidotransferase domain-containing protein [Prauserella rugosa]KMS90603.1 glutamine amidotransferase [Streptomyces regensis]
MNVTGSLSGRRVAFLVAPEGAEQVELTQPWKAVQDAEGLPELISFEHGDVQAFNHLDKADVFRVDKPVSEASVDDYVGLVLPGGVANPDLLRTDRASVDFVAQFFRANKPVAAICHAPWTLIEADVVRGKRMTSYPSLQTDLRNAGADWVDDEVVVDNGLVTSRNPDDLPAFCRKMVEELAEQAEHGQAAHA